MRKLLIFMITLAGILSPAAAQAVPAAALSSDQIKVFSGTPLVFGENLIFDSASGLEIVPFSDVNFSFSGGKLTARMKGIAEVTEFQGYLGKKQMTAYSLSGNNKHKPLWEATAGALVNFLERPSASFTAPIDPQKLVATWVDKDHITHMVETPRKKGEKPKAQVERHKALIDAYKAAFPPVRAGGK